METAARSDLRALMEQLWEPGQPLGAVSWRLVGNPFGQLK